MVYKGYQSEMQWRVTLVEPLRSLGLVPQAESCLSSLHHSILPTSGLLQLRDEAACHCPRYRKTQHLFLLPSHTAIDSHIEPVDESIVD